MILIHVRRSLHCLAAVCGLALLIGCRQSSTLTPAPRTAVSPLPTGTIPSITLNDDATTREVAFTDSFTQEFVDLNYSLGLYLNPDLPTSGSLVNLVILNRSVMSIWFPHDYKVRLLTYDDEAKNWVELPNRVNYDAPNGVILEPSGSQFAYDPVLINPELPATDQPILIRVLVGGEFYENEQPTGRQVGAYTDIRVEP